jgi:putative redox protein
MSKSRITLVEGMQFSGIAESGHEVMMDASLSVGGKDRGIRPSELIPVSFGGCSGMDVISILRKKKQEVTGFAMNVQGEQAPAHPHKFTSLHIEYEIKGRDISEEAVKRAIELSLDRYCSVGATLGMSAKITHSYRIVEE